MGGEQIPDFLFLGLIILPPGLFATGYPMVAFLLFFALLIGGCLSGSGPWEPDEARAEAEPDPDSDVR